MASQFTSRRLSGWQRGEAAAEFALSLPLFFSLVMMIVAFALGGFSRLWTAGTVPLEARAAAGLGQGGTLGAFGVTAAASGSLSVGPAPGCARAIWARTQAEANIRVPLLSLLRVPLRAGSVSRNWRFWPGPAVDACE
jgi:hypothetical protein